VSGQTIHAITKTVNILLKTDFCIFQDVHCTLSDQINTSALLFYPSDTGQDGGLPELSYHYAAMEAQTFCFTPHRIQRECPACMLTASQC